MKTIFTMQLIDRTGVDAANRQDQAEADRITECVRNIQRVNPYYQPLDPLPLAEFTMGPGVWLIVVLLGASIMFEIGAGLYWLLHR